MRTRRVRSVAIGMRLLTASTIIGLALCRPAAADGERTLPGPEYDMLNYAMTRPFPDEEYVETLPRRWTECNLTAAPYAAARLQRHLQDAGSIRFHCLDWMREMLAELYFSETAFRSDGITDSMTRASIELGRFGWEMYNGTPDCWPRCGMEREIAAPDDWQASYLAAIVELMALRTGRIRDVPAWRKAWAEAPAALHRFSD